jgi:hypothetical protein
VGVNEISLRLYRETAWHLESKERLGKTCIATSRIQYSRSFAVSDESESRYIDTLNTNINIHVGYMMIQFVPYRKRGPG